MEINWNGLILGAATFIIIGVFHPIVIKTEYYFGARKTWIFFLLAGLAALAGSLIMADILYSTLLGVLAFSLFWSIGELFEQEERVKKGWFPRNPKKKEKEEKS